MKIEIYGSTLSCAYAALTLNSREHDITWFFNGMQRPSLRPSRLNQKCVNALLDLARRHQCPMNFLLSSPSIVEWQPLQGENITDIWRETAGVRNRWVDSQRVLDRLLSIAEGSGIRLVKCPKLPKLVGSSAQVSIVDASREELDLWSPHFFHDPDSERSFVYECSIHFPRAPRNKRNTGQIANVDGIHIDVEAHPTQGVVLSAYSSSENKLRTFVSRLLSERSHQSTLPLALSVLSALNPQPQLSMRKLPIGSNGLHAPQVFPLGSGVGSLFPQGNMQTQFSLENAIELSVFLGSAFRRKKVKLLELSEHWTIRGQKSFGRRFQMSKLWKNLSFSRRSQRVLLSTATLLPPFLRERLQSPL